MRPLLSLIGSAVFIAIACEVRASFPYRRLERPASQAGSPSTTSYAEKTLTWPAGGGTLDFDYFVDSEQGWDFLRVLIDGTQAYGWSGPAKAGHVRRAMTSGPEEDHGYIHFEIKVELKARGESGSSVLTDNLLGFGLVHKSLTGDLGLEVFPQLQGREPLDEDTWTWATLDFGSVYADGPRLSGVWLYDSYFH